MSQNTSKTKFTYVNSQRGHSDLVGGYSHQYGTYATSLPTVANNSNHDMNKSVAASQQGMYPNAGMPTSGQHHQTMGGPVPSPTTIMQTGQQMSRNPPINIPPSYFQRNNVPRSMPSMARNPLAPVVNQPGQQPSSQFSHMSMVQPAFHPPLPLVVNQFPQSMYPQRHYTPQQYPAMISPGQHLYVNSYNFNTPPPQNSNGYYPTHGMSSYQSIQPQMAPQTIPPPQQQQQPPQHRKGGKAIPIIDPNTGKNILTTEKNTDESNVRPNVEKENEKNDKSIGVQFASQVAAVLNDNSNEQPSKPQAESIRITESLNISSEKETMMNEEPPVSELVDELANIEDLSEIELIENQHNTYDTSIVYYRKDIEENVKEHIDNSTSYQKVDTECVIQDNEQIADTVLDEPSQLDIDEIKTVIETQKFESNILLQKSIKTAEITSKEQLFIESDSPSITNETVQSDTTAANLNKEEILDRNSNKHTVEESSTNLKIQASNES
ncbi:hypothetical protein CDAR_17222 [Caerostris darwini]|uniref:Uncharacterized protein n=2 Tax=Caerostris darwini TaxID=1538125 RepID=A0AAV4M5Z7_9ARAC|nr:hypothetical protein CDAR_17222 [Caerostris darwini]